MGEVISLRRYSLKADNRAGRLFLRVYVWGMWTPFVRVIELPDVVRV